jgi:hypothetical protein
LGCHHHPLPQQPELHPLRYYAVGDEVPLGRFVRTLLRQLVQELLKSDANFCPGRRLRAPPGPSCRALAVLPARTPPGTDSNPSPLGPQPLPGRPGPERGAPPPGASRRGLKNQDLVFGALTEVGTAGGSSAPIGWWDRANRQVAPGRPHGGGRI